jgi:hypothetical protein
MSPSPRTLRVVTAVVLGFVTGTSFLCAADTAALAAFDKEIKKLEADTAGADKVYGGSNKSFALLRRFAARASAIKTEKLPQEVQLAWKGYTSAMRKRADLFSDWPDDPEKVPKFLAGKHPLGSEYWMTLTEKVGEANKEIEKALERLNAAFEKYGLETR